MPETTIVCPGCAYDIPASSDFCPFCGTKVKESKLCPNCGIELSDSDKICPGCGMDLENGKHCPSCGFMLREIDIFCPHCGMKCGELKPASSPEPRLARESPYDSKTENGRRRLRYTCRECLHHSFDLTSPICPNCGGQVALVCPECGGLNRFGTQKCSSCGKPIVGGPAASSVTIPQPVQKRLTEQQKKTVRYICTSCNHRAIGLNEDRCPICGGPVQSICFHCGELNPFGVETCSSCGKPIVSEYNYGGSDSGSYRSSGYSGSSQSAVQRSYPYGKTAEEKKSAAAKAAEKARLNRQMSNLSTLRASAGSMLLVDGLIFLLWIIFSGDSSGSSAFPLAFRVYAPELLLLAIVGAIGNAIVLAHKEPYQYRRAGITAGVFDIVKGNVVIFMLLVRKGLLESVLYRYVSSDASFMYTILFLVSIVLLIVGVIMIVSAAREG